MNAALTSVDNVRPAVCETRVGTPDDLAFVVDCWAKYELRNGPKDVPFGELKRRARVLLDVPNGTANALPPQLERLLIACVPGEPESILGWACVERGRPPCLHYLYVRSSARRLGVAKALVGRTDIALEYSHVAPRWLVVPSAWKLNMERARS